MLAILTDVSGFSVSPSDLRLKLADARAVFVGSFGAAFVKLL